ncbi:MAG: caspase family protein, partial [Parafilimonas terrae]|nr:caspase family protein [Parafilimonas terrae]
MVSLAHRLFQLAGAVVLVLTLVLTIGRSGAHAAEERRVALVVGVGAYQHLPRLDNTVRDAQLIADKLKATGFDVAIETEPSKNRLTAAVRDFARRVEAAGPDAVAVFYYAGHGVQDDKKTNFLIGADADLRSQVDLPVDALSLDTAMETLEAARPRLTFIVLDACRNSPLPQSAQRSANRGLAREDGRRALLMVFSTAPGDTAEDGPPGGHSPFASALARQLDVPGQESTQMFRAVMRAVSDESGDKQHVFMSNPLAQDFFFRPDAGAPPPPPPITVPQDSTPVRTEPT